MLNDRPKLSKKTLSGVIQAHILNATPARKRSPMWDRTVWGILLVLVTIVMLLLMVYLRLT